MYMMVSTDREADIDMLLLWLCFCTDRDADIKMLMLLFFCSSSTVSSVCYSFLDGGFCWLVGWHCFLLVCCCCCCFVVVIFVVVWRVVFLDRLD